MSGKLDKQKALLDRWMKSLIKLPQIDVIWLEGSLVNGGRANPVSDIDIRFGIRDDAYEQLWGEDPTPLLEGMGEYFPLVWPWRLLTALEGLVVEIMAFRTSELGGKELFEWEILFSRMPEGEPKFKNLPKRSLAETWPDEEEITVEKVQNLTKSYLLMLAHAPTSFHNGEFHSTHLMLDWMRIELFKIMYLRTGIRFPKRSKHLSEVFPEEFVKDLEETYAEENQSFRDLSSVAEALLRSFKVLGKHLEALSSQAGGGFEPEWYYRLYNQTREELRPFLRS